jgi:Leucine-rich repeat (LRR) protein
VDSSSTGQHSIRTNKPAAAGLLPQLQKLELVKCDLFITQFEKLSCISSLTFLKLQQLRLCPESRAGTSEEMRFKRQVTDTARLRKAFTPLMAAALTSLASLSLDNAYYSAFWLSENPDMTATSYPLSTMQRLQRLSLCNVDMAAVFELLPASLTALQLHRCNGMYAIPGQATAQLSNLVQLYLEEVALAPSLLLNFPQVHTYRLHL